MPMRGDVHRLRASIQAYYHSEQRQPFFHDITMEIGAGEIACIFGLSGVGKTTILHAITGLARGRIDGEIVYSIDDTDYTPYAIRKAGALGILPQDPALLPWARVRENLTFPAQLNQALREPSEEAIDNALTSVGMDPSVRNLFPHELSGGMRQRVAFARTLMYEPPFLVLDEAFAALDSMNCSTLAKILHDYTLKRRAVCLLVSHDTNIALTLGDTFFHLSPLRELAKIPKPSSDTILDLLSKDYTTTLALALERTNAGGSQNAV